MAEENTGKFPEGFGLTVSNWLWLLVPDFSFCRESLKSMLMSSLPMLRPVSTVIFTVMWHDICYISGRRIATEHLLSGIVCHTI